MNKILFSKIGITSLMLGVGCLFALTGCVGYVEPSAQADVGFAADDDYVYYPGYEMYYGSRSHRWYDHEGTRWVARSAPRGVTVDRLRNAPSVTMDFHDSPAVHHSQVAKSYPKNWKPSGGNSGHQEVRKEDNRR